MRATRQLLYFAIVWIVFGSLITTYLWNNQLVYLVPDAVILFLAISTGMKSPYGRARNITNILGRRVIILWKFFIVIGLAVAFVNMVQPLTIFWGVRMIVRYGLLLGLVYQYFSYKDIVTLKRWLYISYTINFLFVLLQFVQGYRGDSIGGIWSSNGNLAAYLLTCCIVFTNDYFHRRLTFITLFFYLMVAFVTAMWAEIKMLYFIIPVIIYACYIAIRKFSAKHIILLLIGFGGFVPTMEYLLSMYYDEEYISQVLDLESMQSYNENAYGFTDLSMNRGTCIEMTTAMFLDKTPKLLFGNGIGSGSRSEMFMSNIGRKWGDLTYYHYFTFSYVLIETGWIGLLIFLICHIIMLKVFFSFYKTTEGLRKEWASIGLLWSFVTFILIYYNATPYSNNYWGYIVWALCLIGIRDCNQDCRLKENVITPTA